MVKQPIPLTPTEVRVLARCPLHYHFRQQSVRLESNLVETLVRETIQQLHAAGGPARISLAECLRQVEHQPTARLMVEKYYARLTRDWSNTIAVNETMALRISIDGGL